MKLAGRLRASLVVRLLVVMVVVGILAGGVGAHLTRSSAREALRDEIEDENRGVARTLAARLDARIEGMVEQLELLASREPLTRLDTGPVELEVGLSASDTLTGLSVHDLEGRPVSAASVRALVDPDDLERRSELAERVSDADGPVVALTEDRFPAVELAVPIEHPPGTPVGVLLGTVPLEALAGDLRARFLGSSATAFVVDDTGTVLSHPDRDRVLGGESYPLAEVLAEPDGVTILEAAETGGDRATVVAAARTRSLDGVVVLEQAESEAFARAGEQVTELTLVLLVVVGLVVVAAGFFGTRALRPLGPLVRTVRRIGEGDRSARAEMSGSAEFRAVATEVNRMADALDRRLTEVESAQSELQALEERFRTAFTEAPVAMALVNRDGRYEQVNPAMCELLDRSEDDLRGTDWNALAHPDDRPAAGEVLDRALRSGVRSYQLEQRYLRSDGTPVWVLVSVAFAGGVDDPRHYIVHLLDLSERFEALEEQARLYRQAVDAEQRLRLVLESAPDATFVVSRAGTIDFVNRRVTEMFGYEPEELLGEPVEVLVPERFREGHVGHRTGFVEAPRTRPMGAGLDLWARRRDGTELPIEVSLSPVEGEHGFQVVAAVRDVTQRRRAEETARALREVRSRQREAMELNDNIVQGLTIAAWSFELDDLEAARDAVDRTLVAARELINDILRQGTAEGIEAGDLVRERPAEFGS